jgi:RES domain-containing protein
MAESVALAVLENLVHMPRQDFPTSYVCVAAVIPDDVSTVTDSDLQVRAGLRGLSSRALGDWWIEAKTSAVLEVRSTVVADEHNFLLNPAHPDFARIVVEPPALFQFDDRLFGK